MSGATRAHAQRLAFCDSAMNFGIVSWCLLHMRALAQHATVVL